jgi:hypothetical protein
MKMLRHYFISNSLDDLELFEEQLESAGVSTLQIHVLSASDADVQSHEHLHNVRSFMKSDLVHSTTRGAVVGLAAFVLVLAVAYFAGWTQTAAGWVPFIFLAVMLLGFCTWEGGLSGIQRPNHNFTRFEQALKDGTSSLSTSNRARSRSSKRCLRRIPASNWPEPVSRPSTGL